jgi:hypothetical protein
VPDTKNYQRKLCTEILLQGACPTLPIQPWTDASLLLILLVKDYSFKTHSQDSHFTFKNPCLQLSLECVLFTRARVFHVVVVILHYTPLPSRIFLSLFRLTHLKPISDVHTPLHGSDGGEMGK